MTLQFARVFDLAKIRYRPTDTHRAFTNHLATDGHAASFIFAKAISTRERLPDLDIDDFDEEDLHDHFELWGLDPGHRQVFVASNGHGIQPHQVRSLTKAEYYEKSGFTKTNKKMEKLRKADHPTSDSAASIESLEKQLLSLKTSSLQVYHLGLFSINGVFPQLLDLYDTRFNQFRFLNYQGKQRMQAEMVNIFVNGGRKYDKRKARGRKKYRKEQKGKKRKGKRKESVVGNPAKWEATGFQKSHKIPLIAFGTGSWGAIRGGGLPGVSGMCRSVLKKAENQGLLVVVPIHEAYTSQVCNNCQRRTLKPIRDDDGEELHSILACNEVHCKTVWNRDVVASKNIFQVAASIASGEGRPEIFQFAS